MVDRTLDLNADLGEEVTDDAGLLEVVTSANLACGYHAGNRAIMREVCAGSARRGVSVGAQVSYDDRENFGRVARDVPYELLREQVVDQVGTLRTIAAGEGIEVRYVKPHGALYHRVIDDEEQAPGGARRVRRPAGARHAGRAAPAAGRRGRPGDVREGFPDRGYGDDGRLLPRDRPGAVLEQADQIAARAVELAVDVDSVCVHGDTPGAVANARAVRTALEAAGLALHGL